MKYAILILLAVFMVNAEAKPKGKRVTNAKKAEKTESPQYKELTCNPTQVSVNDPEDKTCPEQYRGKTEEPSSCSQKCLRVCVDRQPAAAPEGM